MDFTGKVIKDRYKITDKLGEGTITAVYKGIDLLCPKIVIIKVLKDRFADDRIASDRFFKEARAHGNLVHKNITATYDVIHEDDCCFFIMEYIGNGTLKHLMEEKKVINISEALKYTTQICNALECSYQKKIIHRNIKPENIMVTDDKEVKVSDFGLLKSIDTQIVTMDSAYYLSPEQIAGKMATESSDFYSLGVVLYYMVTGRRPFEASSIKEILNKHVEEELKVPSSWNSNIPIELDKVICKLLEKKIENRYNSLKDLLQDLKNCTSLFEEQDNSERDGKPLKFPTPEPPECGKEFTNGKMPGGKTETSEIKNKGKSSFNLFILIVPLFLFLIAGLVLGGIFIFRHYKSSMVFVPDMRGMTVSDAEIKLGQTGLISGNIKKEYNTSYEKDKIIFHEPPAGKKVKKGIKISFVVSLGKKKILVPNIVNKTFPEGEKILKDLHLRLLIIRTEIVPEVEPDRIISQEPSPGKEVDENSQISVVVSKEQEAEKIIVPELTGLSKDMAENILKTKDLQFIVRGEEHNETIQKGLIISQEPPPDTEVEKNSTVKVVLSAGKEDKSNKVSVPNVLDKTLADAKKTLEGLGLKVVPRSDKELIDDKMVVYFQSPVEGEEINKGEEVLLKIKLPEINEGDVEIPDMVGMTLAKAKGIIESNNLKLGNFIIQPSEERSGIVLSQNPPAGSKVKSGTEIILIVSK